MEAINIQYTKEELLDNELLDELERNILFNKIFKHSTIGLIIIDEDTKLVVANEYIFKIFKEEKQEVIGKKFGNLFNCSVLKREDDICGTTEKCSNCELRNGVSVVLSDDIILEDVELKHNFKIQGYDTEKWFKVSASSFLYNNKKYAMITFVDISKQKKCEKLLYNKSIKDFLTGLYNREFIMDYIQNFKDIDIDYDSITLVLIDLDNFKTINDENGHVIGDEILEGFSKVMKKNTRSTDIVGRYGGDEFIMVFPGSTEQSVKKIIERIKNDYKDVGYKILSRETTFSAGIIEISHEYLRNKNIKDIISLVDNQLYKSKNNGRNTISSCICL